jgi:hypothetical protein
MATTAGEIKDQRRVSERWMESNFYEQWETVWKNYFCEADPEKDERGKPDRELTSIGMPDTFGFTRRTVARITAQPPNLRFHAKDPELAELISRTLMYQWDKAKQQRLQKKHVAQALLFGISIKAWYWEVEEYQRTKRIDPMGQLTPEDIRLISNTYKVDPRWFSVPVAAKMKAASLLSEYSRNGLLPVKYAYKAYEGPKADWIFAGDCYFEPNFQTLQTSNWFILDRRRNLPYLKRLSRLYPQMRQGLEKLVRDHPTGSPGVSSNTNRDTTSLRNRLLTAIDRSTEVESNVTLNTQEWTITERHIPGVNPKWALVAEEDIYLGEIDHPYDLQGKIPFTDCVLIDNLLCGIGDSTARIMRGLQLLHQRQVNRRFDLIYNILRPLIGTTNRELFENPGLIKRHGGFRLVYMRGQGDMWVQPEQAAMASAAASMSDEQGIMQLLQMMTGESNMSMMANVDPMQSRTATGAKLLQANLDVLSKDLNDMFAMTSLAADGELMYLLNRSELSEPIEFNGAMYNRKYSHEQDMLREQWMKIGPEQFQIDGEVIPEVGSTLADDDEARVGKATMLYGAAMQAPTLFNVAKARDEFLIAHGKGRELAQWAAEPPPPPPPPEMKSSTSVSWKGEELRADVQAQLLSKLLGVEVPMEGQSPEQPPGPMPPPGPPGVGPMPPGPPAPGPPPGAVQ